MAKWHGWWSNRTSRLGNRWSKSYPNRMGHSVTVSVVTNLRDGQKNFWARFSSSLGRYFQRNTKTSSGAHPALKPVEFKKQWTWISDLPYVLSAWYSINNTTHSFTTFIFMAQLPPVDQGLLAIEAAPSHSDILQSAGLLWASEQLVAETSTSQQPTLIRLKHPCPRWNTSPQSQQASCRRPTP
jgi:hypothetical protein